MWPQRLRYIQYASLCFLPPIEPKLTTDRWEKIPKSPPNLNRILIFRCYDLIEIYIGRRLNKDAAKQEVYCDCCSDCTANNCVDANRVKLYSSRRQ